MHDVADRFLTSLAGHALSFFSKDSNEFPTDPLALFFGVRNALELTQEPVGGVYAYNVQCYSPAVHFKSLFELVFAQQAVVYKNIRGPVADGPMEERRASGGRRT